jgi:hypothetical protein
MLVGKSCWMCSCSRSSPGVGGCWYVCGGRNVYCGGREVCVSGFVGRVGYLSSPVFKESIFLFIGKILSRASAEIRSGADRF